MCKCKFECNKWHKVEKKEGQCFDWIKYRKYKTTMKWAVEITRGYGRSSSFNGPKSWSQERIIYRDAEQSIDKNTKDHKEYMGISD